MTAVSQGTNHRALTISARARRVVVLSTALSPGGTQARSEQTAVGLVCLDQLRLLRISQG